MTLEKPSHPMTFTACSPSLNILVVQKEINAQLTGLGLGIVGTGSGIVIARGLGTVRLNSLGTVTLALVFKGVI